MSKPREKAALSRCPRCGGEPAPRRQPTARNPFLPKTKKLVCSLCGLDYEDGAPPWAPDRSAPEKK